MTELKYGGSDVKIMYGSQEIGGGHKSGDIVFSASNNNNGTIRQYTAPYKPSKDDEYTIRIIYMNNYNNYVLQDADATPDNISSIKFSSSKFKFAINSNGELSGIISNSTSFIVVVVLK